MGPICLEGKHEFIDWIVEMCGFYVFMPLLNVQCGLSKRVVENTQEISILGSQGVVVAKVSKRAQEDSGWLAGLTAGCFLTAKILLPESNVDHPSKSCLWP